jgi:hypothetical protein
VNILMEYLLSLQDNVYNGRLMKIPKL